MTKFGSNLNVKVY